MADALTLRQLSIDEAGDSDTVIGIMMIGNIAVHTMQRANDMLAAGQYHLEHADRRMWICESPAIRLRAGSILAQLEPGDIAVGLRIEDHGELGTGLSGCAPALLMVHEALRAAEHPTLRIIACTEPAAADDHGEESAHESLPGISSYASPANATEL